MSILMNPVLPVPGTEMPKVRAEKTGDSTGSFAEQLDRQLNEKYSENRDKLGVPARKESGGSPVKTGEKPAASQRKEKTEASGEKDNDSPPSVSALLSQFMAELREVAAQKTSGPGDWQVELPDTEILQQLAEDAGMNEADFSQFMQQLADQNKKISLVDFFAALSSHFEKMNETQPVTIPESEFPLLEALLAKMGLTEDALADLARKAGQSDGQLDLSLLLQGLNEAAQGQKQTAANTGLTPVTLTDWEAEQLQNLLAEAGLTLEKQNELLPERFLNQAMGSANAGEPVQLTLDRLRDILDHAITAVRDSQPKVDLPSFLTDLQKVVSQSGFESRGVGWTPVVQETVNDVFRKLQELVDLATAKVEGGPGEGDLSESVTPLGQESDEAADSAATMFSDLSDEDEGDTTQKAAVAGEETGAARSAEPHQPAVTFTVKEGGQATAQAAREAGARTPSRQLQQQVLQQLSDGVVRGLKNQEHHLVLRLYPQDLGEVKVSLTVRDDHVSVSFNMENSKVKEMLESNMEEFKDSMNQKGFNLGECSVSVGQGNDGSERWQRFELARNAVNAARDTTVKIPDDALYLQAASLRADGRESGINLIV
ncbi:MAG: flagellar hook-length control protein FliK [Deltaproteobacteria bacterium]|nr:flagellar hook-length control protein FliK [Deltaproteobacteria bacterium]